MIRQFAQAVRELPAPTWVSVLVVACLLADLTHFALAAGQRTQLHPAIVSAGMPLPSKRQTVDIQTIVRAHLFGVDPNADASNASARQPPAPLTLAGVIATDDPSEGYAILGPPGQPTHLYRLGAMIDSHGNGRLSEVHADRVLLDFGGRLETLKLPLQIKAAGGHASRLANLAAADDASLEQPQVHEVPSPAKSWLASVSAGRNNDSEGNASGMLLHPNKLVRRMYGLQEGDVLKAINGVDVNDPEALNQTLDSAGGSLVLTYTRDGTQQTTTVSVNN
jgi:general secretion pathway protein C